MSAPAVPAFSAQEAADLYVRAWLMEQSIGMTRQHMARETEHTPESLRGHHDRFEHLRYGAFLWGAQAGITNTLTGPLLLLTIDQVNNALESGATPPAAGEDPKEHARNAASRARRLLLSAQESCDNLRSELLMVYPGLQDVLRSGGAEPEITNKAHLWFTKAWENLTFLRDYIATHDPYTQKDGDSLLRAATAAVSAYMQAVTGSNAALPGLDNTRDELLAELQKGEQSVVGHPALKAPLDTLREETVSAFGESGTVVKDHVHRQVLEDIETRDFPAMVREHSPGRPEDTVTVHYVRGTPQPPKRSS